MVTGRMLAEWVAFAAHKHAGTTVLLREESGSVVVADARPDLRMLFREAREGDVVIVLPREMKLGPKRPDPEREELQKAADELEALTTLEHILDAKSSKEVLRSVGPRERIERLQLQVNRLEAALDLEAEALDREAEALGLSREDDPPITKLSDEELVAGLSRPVDEKPKPKGKKS